MKKIPKVNTIIIGSAKCGTTTLADILDEHPDCCLSVPKEVRFFDLDDNYIKGEDWYMSHLSHYKGEKVILDATPNYAAMPHNSSAERIYNYNPDVKLVYIVRNPVKRLLSSWKMHFRNPNQFLHKSAKNGFNEYVNYIETQTTHWHHYKFHYQLQHYLKYFPKENIHVMFLEDLKNQRHNELMKLFGFLNISILENINTKSSNAADDKTTLTPFFQNIYDYKIDVLIKKVIPRPLRSKLVDSVTMREKVKYPEPNISLETQEKFLTFIKEDAEQFLIANSKPLDFWRLKF